VHLPDLHVLTAAGDSPGDLDLIDDAEALAQAST